MIIRTIKSASNNYFAVNKSIFDDGLSLSAISLYCYLQANDGEIDTNNLCNIFPDYNKQDFELFFKELEEKGWVATPIVLNKGDN